LEGQAGDRARRRQDEVSTARSTSSPTLAAGDRVNVQGYACKADVAAGTLLARKVTTKAPKGAKEDDDESTTTAATTTNATP
jgi:hypothetical protein